MEAGFARMNCLTVIQTSQGLAEHLLKCSSSNNPLKVVIGYDGRHYSKRFAELAAAAFLEKSFSVIWFRDVVHTPLVPFAVRTQCADAGVMITASHNPKNDNGYKVYVGNGCQINSPQDQAIAKAIMKNLEPVTWNTTKVYGLEDSLDRIRDAYILSLTHPLCIEGPTPPVVYTPMHGVGLGFFMLAANRLLWNVHSFAAELPKEDLDGTIGDLQRRTKIVKEQAYPDPEFPTVEYPNPEEHGALDLAKAEADKLGFKLLLANDPDADRFAAAQKLEDGKWYQFKGDEMGVILGVHVFEKWRSKQLQQGKPLMVTSAVSSQMLAAIGRREGFEVLETLTGFKWIGNAALEAGSRALFGYEEALGYMLPDIVHDKDGISAAYLLLEACSKWQRMPYEMLQDLYRKYGYFETANTYWKSPSLALTKETFEHIRANPRSILHSLAPSTRCRIRDAISGTDTGTEDGRSTLPSVLDNLMITLWLSSSLELQEGVRVTIRASGTEPKIKGKYIPSSLIICAYSGMTVYVECQSRVGSAEAKSGALLVLRTVRRVWFCHPRLQMENKYEAETRS
ncbi:MAG: hypothetical protein LQ340_000281 [Diploschistes diacapsis]|nr:MAG: hypothetical protein LQ340_000281 [Diploschistes diacapsis]